MLLPSRQIFAAVVLLIKGSQAGRQSFRPFTFANSSTMATVPSTLLATAPSSTDISPNSNSAYIIVNSTASSAVVASTGGMDRTQKGLSYGTLTYSVVDSSVIVTGYLVKNVTVTSSIVVSSTNPPFANTTTTTEAGLTAPTASTTSVALNNYGTTRSVDAAKTNNYVLSIPPPPPPAPETTKAVGDAVMETVTNTVTTTIISISTVVAPGTCACATIAADVPVSPMIYSSPGSEAAGGDDPVKEITGGPPKDGAGGEYRPRRSPLY